MSRPAWTSAHSQKQPTERLVSNHRNHQSGITPSCFIQVGTRAKREAGRTQALTLPLWNY